MEKLRKISTMYYLRQIVVCLLIYCILLAVPMQVALADPTPPAGTLPSGHSTPHGGVGSFDYDPMNPMGPRLDIQNVGNGAVINWENFDIGSGATTEFHQVSGSPYVLNRVNAIDRMATGIEGALVGNDCGIFVVNPRGIVIGPGAYISARNFVASALRISDADFFDFATGVIDEMKFTSGLFDSGRVENSGNIDGIESVYLVGKRVTNTSTGVISCPDGLIVLAAGSKVHLAQPGSNVIVKKLNTASLFSSRSVRNEGTLSATDGKIVLAAGDVWSQAILEVKDLAVVANEDVELAGDIVATGDVEVLGGQYFGNSDIEIGGHITATSIRLKNGKDIPPGETSYSGIYVADDKNLTATDGDVIVEAVHDIILGGNVSATGDVFLNADEDGYGYPTFNPETGEPIDPPYNPRHYGGGDLIAKGTITGGGDVDILGNAIYLGDDVTATGGDLTITGRTSKETGRHWVWIGPEWWRYEYVDNDTLLYELDLGGEEGSWGEIIVAAPETPLDAPTTLSAGQDVYIIDGGGTEESPAPDMMTLRGDESLEIVAGAGSGVDDGEIIVENTTIVVEGSELTLEQDLDLDLSDGQWNFDNQDDTDLTLISNEGSVTATTAAGDNAADEWDSIGAQAEQDITLTGDGSIKTTELDSANGKIAVESISNDVTANETVTAHNGSVSVTADDDIKLKKKVTAGGDITLIADADGDKWIFGGDITAYDELETKAGSGGSIVVEASDTILLKDNVTADGSITLTADSDDKWGGDMTAKGNLDAGGNIEISASDWTINLYGDVDAGGDVTLNTNTRFKGSGDQHVDAGGMITAWGWLDKSPGLFSHSDGSLYLHADGDISLDDYVRAARYSLFGKYKGGGVSIISDNGSIFTPDEEGYPTDTLNVPITGRSDHFAGIGVDLPFGEDLGKAAIVIQSSDDLLLGPKANLIARGKYYDDGVDDRAGVDFLDVLADIGGFTRDEGDSFDAAIYVGSTAGNVDIGAEVTIKSSEWVPGRCWGHYEFVPKGAMVADAYDSVIFGDLFEDSLADGDVGDRLEVASRISEWLFEAYNNGRLPYVYGGGPFPPGYTYVLRGAGPDNPGVEDGWVLEDPTDVTTPYEEAGQTVGPLTLGLGGCPVLVAAVSAELGVPGDTIQVSLANSFALNTNIQPCESCARLLNAATILRDEDGSGMAAMNQVFNTLAPAGAPFTPEMATSIATAFAGRVNDGTQYATAIEYIDAFVRYLAVLDTEMGSPVADGDSIAFVMGKYGTGITESDNSNIAAFVATRLESGATFGE